MPVKIYLVSCLPAETHMIFSTNIYTSRAAPQGATSVRYSEKTYYRGNLAEAQTSVSPRLFSAPPREIKTGECVFSESLTFPSARFLGFGFRVFPNSPQRNSVRFHTPYHKIPFLSSKFYHDLQRKLFVIISRYKLFFY